MYNGIFPCIRIQKVKVQRTKLSHVQSFTSGSDVAID